MFRNFIELGIVCTNYCNSNCQFCYSDSLFSNAPVIFNKEEEKRILDNVKKVVRIFFDSGSISLGITGGEPSLVSYNIYDKVIAYMSDLNIQRITFSTNGFLLNEPYLVWLGERNIDLAISYDGFIQYNDKRALIENIEFISKFLPVDRIYLHFLMYKFFDVDHIIELMKEIEWLQFSYSFFIPVGRGRNLDLYFDENFDEFELIFLSREFLSFYKSKCYRKECFLCKFYDFCRGGCIALFPLAKDGECVGLKRLLNFLQGVSYES